MRENRVQDANQPYVYKHGSKWVGDFRKSTFAHKRSNEVSYYVDSSGNRTTRWDRRQTRRTEYIRPIGINLHDFIGAGRYQRRSSKILRCEYEFVEVSATCVLVKRTNRIWNLPNPSGRYSQVTDSMVRNAMQESPNVVEEQIFALLVSENTLPEQYEQVENARNLQQQSLFLGPLAKLNANYPTQIRATKTTPAKYHSSMFLAGEDTENSYVIIKELRGSAAKLWSKEGVSHEEVSRLLRPSEQETAAYTLPKKPKRKKIKWHESEETFSCGSLVFSKMDIEPPLISGDTLYDVYRNEGINIIVSIPEKCLITFPRDGQLVSHEVDSGVFAIRSLTNMDNASIRDQRLSVINELNNYKIEFDLNRYDFLTVVDIDNDILTKDEGSLGRIGSIETIDGLSTSESDSLLDRIG